MEKEFREVNLEDGNEFVLHGNKTIDRSYVYDGEHCSEALSLDFVIEIEHTGLLELIEKASTERNRKAIFGPISIKVSNLKAQVP